MLSPLEPTLFHTACRWFNGAAGGASGKLWWVTGWQPKELWSRDARPAPSPEVSPALSQKMKPNALHAHSAGCISPPGLLVKTKINGTSTWSTELRAVTAGEWSYLSAFTFLPQGQKTLMPRQSQQWWRHLPSCLLVKPQRWWIRALVGRWSRFLGFIKATSSELLPVTGSWLFSDHPVLSESVRWSQILWKPRSERHSWTRLGRKNCPKTADRSRAQH